MLKEKSTSSINGGMGNTTIPSAANTSRGVPRPLPNTPRYSLNWPNTALNSIALLNFNLLVPD